MKINFLTLTVLTTLLSGISGYMLSTTEVSGEIGDVKYSVLPPDVFNKIHQGKWVLLDGKDLSNESQLGKLLDDENLVLLEPGQRTRRRLPDGRGVFLRGMNINRALTKGDAEGDRQVGRYQKDLFKNHKHTKMIKWHPPAGGGGHEHKNAMVAGGSTPKQKWHSGKSGGDETRPRNIALYTYIKING